MASFKRLSLVELITVAVPVAMAAVWLACGSSDSWSTSSPDGGSTSNTPDAGTDAGVACLAGFDGGTIADSCPSPDGGAGGQRFNIVEPGTGEGGSGLFFDLTSMGLWTRFPHAAQTHDMSATTCCNGASDCSAPMNTPRLPTKDEALSVAGENFDSCVWVACWTTWTSTLGSSAGSHWVVGSDGSAWEATDSQSFPALCFNKT